MLRASRLASQMRAFSQARVLRTLEPQSKWSTVEVDAAQAMRTVSKVTPGKLFMMNFISGEQSIMSITNRVNSIIILAMGGLYVMMVWGNGAGLSWMTPAAAVYGVVSLYYHIGPTYTIPLAVVLLALFAFKCHIEK
ncbi:hypothetical protein DIPPA_11214 [Diplonema papillatum]|nr:hypothetical protein DIPPA_11214 [Diplonema papillatum]